MEKYQSLNMTRMIELSMDGPNVNWSFYKRLMADAHETDVKIYTQIDIVHVINIRNGISRR